MHLHHYTSIAEQFTHASQVTNVREFGNGNINDTYLATTDVDERTYPQEKHFILQRINTQVFKQPRLIMQNMRTFTEHVRRRARAEGHRWVMPRVISACDGQDFHIASDGSFWRAISYVYDTRSFETIKDTKLAFEVGYALGTFQYLISDLSTGQLADTLEGFHITPRYLRGFDQAFSHNGYKSSTEVKYCLRFDLPGGRTGCQPLFVSSERGQFSIPAPGELTI